MSFMHNEYSLPSATGTADIYIQSLSPENTNDIIGVIQIIHGMAEHSDRYLDVAEYLCTRGFAVVLYDHAGHGKSIKTNAASCPIPTPVCSPAAPAAHESPSGRELASP